ncbi:MAG: Omp28-related outer membrane protein [Ferruginibacter sp.]
MKLINCLLLLCASLFVLNACTKTESQFDDGNAKETITLQPSSLNSTVGASISFVIVSSRNNTNVTLDATVFVNGSSITGSSYTFTQPGTYAVYAKKGDLTSAVVTLNVVALSNGSFVNNVLVEEYSGTWCGNCPRLLYGVDLLKQQTNKVIFVGTHLFGNDPFITAQGNSLAQSQGVSGVPNGKINRTLNWNGPQYENVNQVINEILPFATAGLAINSTTTGNTLNINVKFKYKEALGANAKLTVYITEDKRYFTQSNYSSNLYGGLSSIPNFEYHSVLRAVVSTIAGDDVASSGTANEKNYSLAVPTTILNIANAKVVAFITNTATGKVVNAQEAKVGEDKMFETL